MIDILLLLIFIGSGAVISVMISKKIPLALATHERLINESFASHPPKIKRIVDATRPHLKRERYESAIVLFLAKVLRRLHVWMLKSDAFVTGLLLRVQNRARTLEKTTPYFKNLHEWKMRTEVTVPEASPPLQAQKNNLDGTQKFLGSQSGDSPEEG